MILMHAPAEHISASDRPLVRIMRERNRTLLIRALTRAPLVIKGDVLHQHALRMSLVQDEHRSRHFRRAERTHRSTTPYYWGRRGAGIVAVT
jgi:hypothetical protein